MGLKLKPEDKITSQKSVQSNFLVEIRNFIGTQSWNKKGVHSKKSF